MIVDYSKSFEKAVRKLTGKMLESVRDIIEEVKKAEGIEDITDCKKLEGYSSVYRIRLGSYRVFFTLYIDISENKVKFEYFVSRGQAYSKKMQKNLRKLD